MRGKCLVTIIFFILFISSSALAISIAELSFNELYKESDQIVLAMVEDSFQYDDEYNFVNAIITLSIEKVYKGDLAKGEVVVVSQDLGYGGSRNNRGDLVIAFLVDDYKDTDFYVLNSHQGLWRVSESGDISGMSSFKTVPEFEKAIERRIMYRALTIVFMLLLAISLIIIAGISIKKAKKSDMVSDL